jgi:hypothetical protein
MPRFTLNRRTFLRGMAGGAAAAVALPALEAMFDANGVAHSDGSPLARRFVAFHFGNGVTLSKFVPAQTGAEWQLSEQLAPLVNVKDYCNVLSGFENKHAQKITHHEGMAGMWSGHPFIQAPSGGLNSKFGGPSIDQVAAAAVGKYTTFPSLEVGVSKRVSKNEGPTMQFMSHKGPDQPLEPEYNPQALFAKLFAMPPPDDPSRPSRVDVLDAVMADANALKTKVSTIDKRRIDAHLESVFALQAQIKALPPVCVKPTMPTDDNVDVGGNEPMRTVSKAMSDLLVYAFACDLTRVASYMLIGGVGFQVYSWISSEEQHVMSHDPVGSAVPLNQTIVWNVEQFAYLCERLKATPDGAGNLLDNSCLLLGTDCSEGWSHSIKNMCVVVAGGGGGALKVGPGQHLRSTSNRNLSDVMLTCVRTVAPEIAEIGSAEMRSNTPVTEIMR